MFARILEIAPKPDKKEGLIQALNQKIVPILKEQPGFLETLVFAPENTTDPMISITFWTEKRFAEKYAQEAYPTVEQIMSPFLSVPIAVKAYTVESILSKHWVDILVTAA
jgi:heme-degrading monooxygenase HmoA